MTELTREDLARLGDLHAKATPGPWHTMVRGDYGFGREADVNSPDGESIDGAELVTPAEVHTIRGQMHEYDARLIAEMHAALPALLQLAQRVMDAPEVAVGETDLIGLMDKIGYYDGQRVKLVAVTNGNGGKND